VLGRRDEAPEVAFDAVQVLVADAEEPAEAVVLRFAVAFDR
jgi:hypothetical protein